MAINMAQAPEGGVTYEFSNPNYAPSGDPTCSPGTVKQSTFVHATPAWWAYHRLHLNKFQKGDGIRYNNFDAVRGEDGRILNAQLDININPQLDPPEWERWEFMGAEIEARSGGRKVEM